MAKGACPSGSPRLGPPKSIRLTFSTEPDKVHQFIQDAEAVEFIFSQCPNVFNYLLKTYHIENFAINDEIFEKITFLFATDAHRENFPAFYFYCAALANKLPSAIKHYGFYEPILCSDLWAGGPYALAHIPIEPDSKLATAIIEASCEHLNVHRSRASAYAERDYFYSLLPLEFSIDESCRKKNLKTIECIGKKIDSRIKKKFRR